MVCLAGPKRQTKVSRSLPTGSQPGSRFRHRGRRRWATLWVLADLGTGAHSELVTMASIRGRFCEIISARRGGAEAGGEGFLLGMCSCLEATQRPSATAASSNFMRNRRNIPRVVKFDDTRSRSAKPVAL